ncbi:MAG: pirin family protein [Hymenobacter sp.]|nr:pirin family protein [Hymenobacter sp.]
MLTLSRHPNRQHLNHGAFQLQRVHPGLALSNPADAGLGPLGLVDHAVVQPGPLVPMHEHRNDEILSYVRSGSVSHIDSTGNQRVLTPHYFMLMGAGRGFLHEEQVLGPGPLHMLQIFIRPSAAELEPRVTFCQFDAADSPNAWRLVAGPAGSEAPLIIRSQVWLYDVHLTRHTLALPDLQGRTAFLYVFSGAVKVSGADLPLQEGDSLILEAEAVSVLAPEDAQLVVFLLDRQASFSRAGTLSG